MTAAENLAIFKRFLRELGRGNYDVINEVCSPEFVFRSPNFPGWPRGFEGARRIAQAGSTLIGNAEHTIDDLFATEDRVVMRMTIRGTFVGEPTPGFPAKGEKFAMGAVAIYRMIDGKIVDDWGIQLTSPTDAPWG
ncbi:MAG TPA: ester cyclase [Candidatus Binataceae bacterium]|nr:ester cyclase [Candidatus Binataceae bacterium]